MAKEKLAAGDACGAIAMAQSWFADGTLLAARKAKGRFAFGDSINIIKRKKKEGDTEQAVCRTYAKGKWHVASGAYSSVTVKEGNKTYKSKHNTFEHV